ncbi:MAG: TetR/AcrR family transcriptional regulator [Candidatus Dormibacteraceae bacterium]
MAVSSERARPGRKRSAERRQAILEASLDLLAEHGYGRLSIEGVAARAGAGKQTIYRWWPGKADLLLEALTGVAGIEIPTDDTGSYASDLRRFLVAAFGVGGDARIVEVLRGLMAESLLDPAFARRFRDGFLERRRSALRAVFVRARERGDLPPSPAPETVLDLVFGVVWYRALTVPEETRQVAVEELARLLAG